MNDQDLIRRRQQTLGPTYRNFYDPPLHLVRGAGTSGRYEQVLKLRPPLPFSKTDADRTIEAIDNALNQFQP